MSDNERDGEGRGAMPDDVFTLYEARRYLGEPGKPAGRATMQRYMLDGRLPFENTSGGRVLFRRVDLDAIRPTLEANRVRYRSDELAEKRRKKGEEGGDA